MIALVEIAEVGRDLGSLGRRPDSVVPIELSSIRRQSELRVGAEIGGDLPSLHLVHAHRIGLEGGVGGLKLCLHLVPGRACCAGARAGAKTSSKALIAEARKRRKGCFHTHSFARAFTRLSGRWKEARKKTVRRAIRRLAGAILDGCQGGVGHKSRPETAGRCKTKIGNESPENAGRGNSATAEKTECWITQT